MTAKVESKTKGAESKTKGMCIATRCTSVEQFIQMFHRFVDEDSFFVSTMNTRPPGLETSFSVQLADGTPVLRGICTVLQAWTTSASPFKTPGVRLGIKRLTANSMAVFEQLLATRSAMKPISTPSPVRVPPAPPAKTEKHDDDEPIIETRTAGSDLVLPANPLMNLTDESLEGYVDCTLYEETGNFFPADDDGVLPLDDVIDPPVFAPRPAIGRAPTPLPVEIAAAAPPPPPPASPAPPPREETSHTPPSVPLEPRVDLAPQHRRRPRYWIAGGFAAIAAATLIVINTRGSSNSTAAPARDPDVVAQMAPADKAEIEQAKVPVEPPIADPAVDETPADELPSGDGPQLVGDGPCKLTIETTPAGSIIQLDDQTMAPSPVTVATSCGNHKIDVSHARYQTATKLVTLEAGAPGSLDVRLTRPMHVVMVRSTPPGATIFIDGRRAGTTPSKLDVLGFVTITLELRKTGFQPTTAKLYSKVAQDQVTVRLAKW